MVHTLGGRMHVRWDQAAAAPPDRRDVLGTLMMGPLAGHRRRAHISAPRGDAVAARALVMITCAC